VSRWAAGVDAAPPAPYIGLMSTPYRCDDGAFVICPYCAEPLSTRTESARFAAYRRARGAPKLVPCATCGLDLTRDAPQEAYAVDGRPRGDCRHCAGSILKAALFCHHCRKWQSSPFER
jgi:hypothetical protein